MKNLLEILKDIIVVLTPIVVAFISYRSNKKTKEDISYEIEKSLKEKDAETTQIIQKINAELESQKQLVSWNNSLPQVNKYTELADPERYGNISSLTMIIKSVGNYIDNEKLSAEELNEIKDLLGKVKLPLDEEKLFAYEIPYLIDYRRLIKKIDMKIKETNNANSNEE